MQEQGSLFLGFQPHRERAKGILGVTVCRSQAREKQFSNSKFLVNFNE